MPWVLGLDGGGTRTVALVANEKGRVLGRGEAGPSNYHTAGLTQAAEAVQQAFRSAVEDAGLMGQALTAAYFAVAGVDRPVDRQVMATVVASLGLNCPTLLEHDSTAALAGATGGKPGVVVVAQTGSVAYGEDANGNRTRIGGYGPLLSDEGSGYDIGRRAMIAALRAEEGRGPQTCLKDQIERRFMLDRTADLVNLVYGTPAALQRKEIAFLVPMVSEAAQGGDAVAREILRTAGRELGLLAVSVLDRLKWPEQDPVNVAGVGGVYACGNLLAHSMKETLGARYPNASLCQPHHTPTYGAVLLALRSLGIQLEEAPGERNATRPD